MPLATNQTWIKTYGRLPWWRVRKATPSAAAYDQNGQQGSLSPLKQTPALSFVREAVLTRVKALIAEHPDWSAEQIKEALKQQVFNASKGSASAIAQQHVEHSCEEERVYQFEPSRELTSYEKKVDFATIQSQLDHLEAQSKERIRAILLAAREKLLTLISRKLHDHALTTKFVNDLELRGLGQLIPTLREITRAVFRIGQQQAAQELKRSFAQHTYDWNEGDHPREDNGEFAPAGGSGGSANSDVVQGKIPPLDYKSTSGNDPAVNAELVSKYKIKIIAPPADISAVQRALSHVLSERSLAEHLSGKTVELKSLPKVHGTMKSSLFISREDLAQNGPGFVAAIIRHELEHVILSKKGIPSPQQESRVRYTAGLWAAMKASILSSKNPSDAAGLRKAAIEQGIKLKGFHNQEQIVQHYDWNEADHPREDSGTDLSHTKDRYTQEWGLHTYQVRHTLEGLPPQKALEFFDAKATLWGADIRDPLLSDVKGVLYDAIKMGTPLRDVQSNLQDVFLPWLGDPDQQVNDELLMPYRLETMIRTNTIEALNEGRKTQFEPEIASGFITGLQFSAILDARTTDVCKYLDKMAFPPSSPELDRLTPPRHYSCRSVLVPITRNDGPVQFITAAQVAKGIELSGKGFDEEQSPRHYDWNEGDHPREDNGEFAPAGGSGSGNAKSANAIRVVGSGKDRTFVNADGSPVDSATQSRINALSIPPAWTSVQVSTDPQSPLQAIGTDASGKEQYRYSKQWTSEQNAAKHLRVAALAQDGYKSMVAGVSRDLAAGKEEAVVMQLILATAMRVGGDSEKAVGATTLQAQHLQVDGARVSFNFLGKSGKQWEGTIQNQELASQIGVRLQDKAGTDRVFSTDARRVNAYLKQYGPMSAKDVRTLQGTAVAYKTAKELGMPQTVKEAKIYIRTIITKVSEHLRNTPAVAKSSYIDPAIWAPIQAKFGIAGIK